MKLIANNIHKNIKGKTILNDISLEMETGNIYGFWGRNGSGKTMLFRALSGLMKIDSGNIYWNDKELHKDFAVLQVKGLFWSMPACIPIRQERKTYYILRS